MYDVFRSYIVVLHNTAIATVRSYFPRGKPFASRELWLKIVTPESAVHLPVSNMVCNALVVWLILTQPSSFSKAFENGDI